MSMSKGIRLLEQPQRASSSGIKVEEMSVLRNRKDLKTMGKVISFVISIMLLSSLLALLGPKVTVAREFLATGDYSSEIEKQIRSGKTTTTKLIVNYHPRIWLRGSWDLDKNNVGSFAWQIVHGSSCEEENAACDNMKDKFCYISGAADTYMYGKVGKDTYGRRYLWSILAAEGVARKSAWKLPLSVPWVSEEYYNPRHTEDQLLSDARAKLLSAVDEWDDYVGAHTALHGTAGYDWLVNRKYSDGVTPVLSDVDRVNIQNRLISMAEKMKSDCKGQGQLLGRADQIYKYFYPVIGMALYEPDGKGISLGNNAKAKEYLDDFDTYWVGKILPALNEQGGTGGWHAGLCYIYGEFPEWGYYGSETLKDTLPYRVAPLLYAHYTATGQGFANSIYDTGFLKYAGEFWNYMIYPDGHYVPVGPQTSEDERYTWIGPLFSHARRRFSSDNYDQWVGELIGWVRNEKAPSAFVNAGSYDMFDQLMFEEKYPSPRTPEQLGCGTRHFAKLGWVAMRSGFTSKNDLAALFICQRYHWSDLNPYAQNSFHIMRRGWLIKGNRNTIYIDRQYQRSVSGYPTVAQGAQAYSPGSKYDVGPGIQAFESNRTYDYIKGDATNAYDHTKVKNFTRQWVYLKPDIFVIFDNVITTKPDIEKKWVVVPATTPTDLGNNVLRITNGDGALWIKRLLPISASINLSASQVAVVPAEKANQTLFLHVMQAVDSNKDAKQVIATDATVVVEGDGFLVNVGSHKMRFTKDGGFEWIGGHAKTP
jgi:hypothetical protein